MEPMYSTRLGLGRIYNVFTDLRSIDNDSVLAFYLISSSSSSASSSLLSSSFSPSTARWKKNVSVFYSRYVSSIVINSCFRFVTILYYLNDVEEGGQTAFLIADNMTTTPDVSISNHCNFLPPSSLTMCALFEQVWDLNIESKIPDSTVFYRS